MTLSLRGYITRKLLKLFFEQKAWFNGAIIFLQVIYWVVKTAQTGLFIGKILFLGLNWCNLQAYY
jgi:hypothetical protein